MSNISKNVAGPDTVDSGAIIDGAIVNADVNSSAAIVGSKLVSGTDSTTGALELATDAEVLTGTDTARAVTAANVAAKMLSPGAIGTTAACTELEVDNLNLNGNTITATSGAVNITPAAESAIVLDGTISIDAGLITGVTSITLGGTALGDYVQGTFTPTLTAASVGDLSVSYTTQSGTYTRIGNVVYFHLFLDLSTISQSTASGDARIGGLPVTSVATIKPLVSCLLSEVDIGSTAQDICGEIQAGTVYATIIQTRDVNTPGTLAITTITTGDTITLSGHYFV